jgi:hypothetical protein
VTRLIRLAARLLYPPAWRHRYGAEFDALIDDVPGSAAALIDVVSGGLAMRMRMSHPVVMVLGLAAAGALVAGATAFAVPAKFESRGTMRLSSADPGERWPAVFNAAMARAFPAGEVAPANVSVIRTAGPDSTDEITVAYRSRDPHQARDVVQRLMGAAIEANLQQAEGGGRPAQIRVQTPAGLPVRPSRHVATWLAAGGFLGVLFGGVVARRRRA